MKVRNPKTRFDLEIKTRYKVLEVGGGHDPHPRSNIVVDKYAGDLNRHRCGDLKLYANQEFIEADGETLPFKDKSFDYSICSHVLEHVINPDKFIEEQARVSKMGYMETPSLIGEYIMPKQSHKWVILEIDNKLVLYDKSLIDFQAPLNFGYLFLDFLPKHSLGYKILQRTQPNLTTVNYEWKDNIDYLVNPDDQYYLDFFTKPWEKSVCDRMIVQHTLPRETLNAFLAFAGICKSVFKSKVLKKSR